MFIRIKGLRVNTYIGFNPEELVKKQEVIINLQIRVGSEKAMLEDEPLGIYDYKVITKRPMVRKRRFKLLEVLTRKILTGNGRVGCMGKS